jgi:hypothetical protein
MLRQGQVNQGTGHFALEPQVFQISHKPFQVQLEFGAVGYSQRPNPRLFGQLDPTKLSATIKVQFFEVGQLAQVEVPEAIGREKLQGLEPGAMPKRIELRNPLDGTLP